MEALPGRDRFPRLDPRGRVVEDHLPLAERDDQLVATRVELDIGSDQRGLDGIGTALR